MSARSIGSWVPGHGERVSRDALGGIVIESTVRAPSGRKGYEDQLFPGVEVGLAGWDRAHSQGNITGHESAYAIRYAPSEVNQQLQRLGIERFIRELHQQCRPDVQLGLTTVTYTHPGTLRLKEIQYKVTAGWRGRKRVLFEAAIEIEDRRIAPRVKVSVIERTPRSEWAGLYR
jgi:hypothetical protein